MRFSTSALTRPFSGPAGRAGVLRIAAGMLGLAMVASLGVGSVSPAAAQTSMPDATSSAQAIANEPSVDGEAPAGTGPQSATETDVAADVAAATSPMEDAAAEGVPQDADAMGGADVHSDETVDEQTTKGAGSPDSVEDSGASDPTASENGPQSLAARLANPVIPEKCGLNMVIVLDLSNSLSDSDVKESKNAAKSVVTSLTGTPSNVGVYTFATFAPDNTNKALPLTSVSTTGGASSVSTHIDALKRVPTDVGGTNWDAALRQIPQATYDIVLFVTDGNPTAYGTPHKDGTKSSPKNNTDFGTKFNDLDLSEAVTASDTLKSAGAFVMGLGVGSSVNSDNLKKISGPTLGTDYFKIDNYNGLTQKLSEIALKNCQGTVSIVKQVRDVSGNLAPASGWKFSGRASDNVIPNSAVTDDNGAVNFKIGGLENTSRTVRFTEVQQPGHTLESQGGQNAKCVNNTTGKPVAVTNAGPLGFDVAVNVSDAVSCEVINAQVPSVPVILKTSTPESGTEVKPGQKIEYSVSFKNEGIFPAMIDHVDHLADVLDDAVFNNDLSMVGSGLSAKHVGDQIRITGSVAPGKTVVLTYSVTVKTESFGNGVARNFLVPSSGDPVCNPQKTNCTEHPIPGALTVNKSSDPASGSFVAPGSTVHYTLSFRNSGASPVPVNHVDHLTDVLDDADFQTEILIGGEGLTAVQDGEKIRIAGTVKAESTVTVTYSVHVRTSDFGNGVARNFLLPDGEEPPTACEPEQENCTEHPILGVLTWDKVDGSNAPLSGSEWELVGPGSSGPRAITDCVADSAAGCLGEDRNPAAGGFEMTDLVWGEYILRETEAPVGYLLDPAEHRFTIGGTTALQLVVRLDPVVNQQHAPFALPLTGGTGARPYTLIGGGLLLLAILATGWIFVRRTKSKRP